MERAHSGCPEPLSRRSEQSDIAMVPERWQKWPAAARNLIPLSRFPPGQAGAGGFPPRQKHAARQQKALARIDAAGSPHKRAAAPLWIPCERCLARVGADPHNRVFQIRTSAEIGRRWRTVYTKDLTLPVAKHRARLPDEKGTEINVNNQVAQDTYVPRAAPR